MKRPIEHDARLEKAIDFVFAFSMTRQGSRGEIFPDNTPMLVHQGVVGERRHTVEGRTLYRHVVRPGEVAIPVSGRDIVVLSPHAQVQIAPARRMRTLSAQLVLGASDRHRADQAEGLSLQRHSPLATVAWALHELGEAEIPLHQTDLAFWTGISRESVNKQFRALRAREIIAGNTIVDREALELLYQR